MKEAIVVDRVTKRFPKHLPRGYTTLKEALLKGHLFAQRNSRQYVEALKEVSFSVPEGTVLGVIGPNGAGKSTLLRLIAGIYRPTSGKVVVNGRLSALLNLGLGFHPELTGRENIVIGGLAIGLSRREVMDRMEEIIEFAELRDFIDAPVRTYSSGMYMRLAFSVVVNVDPDILLLDEVLAVGDARFAEKSRAKIEEFKRRGKTILLVTHDLTTVESWCHQALWLERGRVRALGDPKQVVEAYKASVMVARVEQ
ncbi:MAG: ABC transporter ATP-binding protein [Candidatus Caldatribacterium sp.]|nr:ABC transporter ATP-binding protein [Candidatus Caldatribacterium sp.]